MGYFCRAQQLAAYALSDVEMGLEMTKQLEPPMHANDYDRAPPVTCFTS